MTLSLMNVILYDSFPLNKTIKSKSVNTPWVTNDTLKFSKIKQKLYDKYFKSKTYQSKTDYSNFLKFFKSIKVKAKKQYYSVQMSK